MSNNTSIIFFTMMASFSLTSYAAYNQFAPQVHDAQKTYELLLQSQSNKNPMENNPQVAQMSRVAVRQDFQLIFKNAETTGLVAQCEKLLTGSSFIQMKDFISPEHLQVIAYMQNKYGNGNPFVYNGPANNNDLSQTAVLGTYKNPRGQVLTITRYSFFNTLLDTLNKSTYSKASNPYFKQMYDTINNNLSTALQLSQKSALQDPRQKLAGLLNKFNEFAQINIQHNATASIDIIINGLEEIMKKASFGRGY